ncbi:MAG: UvrD-helicase domain-containing protein [Calditrichota bacterium]
MDLQNLNLNAPQREAVEHIEGPLLILAGAGSGKTRVLAARAAHLVHSGQARPYHILALTFTNKAARELKSRSAALVGAEGHLLAAGTFHSLFARLMRQEGLNIGVNPHFTILDTEDKRRLLKTLVTELKIDPAQVRPAALDWMISQAKNNMITPDAYERQADRPNERSAALVYRLYEKRLRQINGMDFDDLLIRPLEAMDANPDFLHRLQKRFRFVMVDEFQDTNRAQYLLVHNIAKQHRNLCVVGDDDQAIYGWRGATVRNILDFNEDWPDARIIRLEQNYRSTSPILETAWSVIRHNPHRHPKKLWTEKPGGELIDLIEADDDEREAMSFIGTIQDWHKTHETPYSQFAILYRTNAQSLPFERTLRAMQIPYRVVGGLRFYERKEVKDLLAYLRAVINPADDISLQRIINYPPRGISDALTNELAAQAREQDLSLNDVFAAALQDETLPPRRRKALEEFSNLLARFRKTLQEEPFPALAVEVVHAVKLRERLAEEERDDPSRAESKLANLEILLQDIYRYHEDNPEASLTDFLEEVALVTDADKVDESLEHVNLMTLHSAKGLEFSVVLIGGVEEGLLPLQPPDGSSADVEEERRLFYVGVTRAMDKLVLGYAQNRLRWGNLQWNGPSRFFKELPEEHICDRRVKTYSSRKSFSPSRGRKPKAQSLPGLNSDPSMDVDSLHVGLLVKHPKFGLGVVTQFNRNGLDSRVKVDFDEAGLKTLVLRYARLEIAGKAKS